MSNNFKASVALFEDLLVSVVGDEEALMNLKLSEMKARTDAKLNKQIIRRAMTNYARFGAISSYTNVLSQQELDSLKSEELVELIHNLTSFSHMIT